MPTPPISYYSPATSPATSPADSPAAAPAIDRAAAPLSPEQIQQLASARERAQKLRRAQTVAKFDGWTVAIFAGLTALTGIFSPVSLLLAAGMGYVAWRELRGVELLRKLDRTACRALAMNQVVLGSVLMLYALWQIYRTLTSPGELAAALHGDPQLQQAIGSIGSLDQLAQTITLCIYGGVIAIAIFVQGGTALYYLSRQKVLDAYLSQTPAWIVEMQRAGISV